LFNPAFLHFCPQKCPLSNLQIERATGSAPTFIGGESVLRTSAGGVAHVAIALAAPSLASGKSLHALGVWQALLGGTPRRGGAAGQLSLGPQRQSRVARSVHTEAHSFIRSLSAFALPYSDSGILGLAGSCADHEAGRLVHAIVGFVKDSAGQPILPAELERAKKQYKLALLGQVEGRAGAASDSANQLLLTGQWQTAASALAAIDAVTAADVQQVARAALASPPAIAATGSLEQVPRYDALSGLLK
jgi:predicted Zn-dependent peptidase